MWSAKTLNGKGLCLQDMDGKLDESIDIFNQCLSVYNKDEETQEKYKEFIAMTESNLGISYKEKGDFDKALEHYEKCPTGKNR